MLKTRLKTAAVLILLIAVLLIFSHIELVMHGFVALLSTIAVWELYKGTGNLKKYIPFIISLIIAAAVPFLKIPHYVNIICIALPLAIILFLLLMGFFGKYSLNSTYKAFLLSLLPPLFYTSFSQIRIMDNGLYYILLFALVCAVTDSGAYFIGRAMGKRKLAPNISPKKTIEGSIGGTVCAVAVMLIIAVILNACTSLTVGYIPLIVYTIIASVIDQIGDLAMSVIKRTVGIKDYSNLMPGHGGVLDRFDSYMFVAPFTLIYCYLITPIII